MRPPKPENSTSLPVITNPAAPLTIEGSSVLHQMTRFRRAAWRILEQQERDAIAREAASALREWEKPGKEQSAVYSMLGHKGDLLFVHFRESFDGLNAAEWRLGGLRIWDYLDLTTSYVSVVELGLYNATVKLYESLEKRGVKPGSQEWIDAIEDALRRQREAMSSRLWPEIPPYRYICFYPMDRKRGESKNWYTVPIADRGRMMMEHGTAGRKYGGAVQQIITGSMGFDDWEWGVDLFSDNPLVFKQLIYEMRFDEASAEYAAFGPFYTGIRVAASDLPDLLAGHASA